MLTIELDKTLIYCLSSALWLRGPEVKLHLLPKTAVPRHLD